MDIYIKESLYVLDYNNNIVDTIFVSDDHMTPGYAYNVTITEENTGYSDLKFDMPNTIINDEAEKIKNPKLELLTPLVKLRYRREVYYTGDKVIKVKEPVGYGDTTTYIEKTYSPTYPDNIIENYIMDYIVQPVDKKRDVLKINTSFTAIDYPRFTLSKKKMGLTITKETETKEEWSLFKNKPMDQPGTIKYVEWNEGLAKIVGEGVSGNSEWDPSSNNNYPLTDEQMEKLIDNENIWPYGLLATAIYWRIKEDGRVNGTLYKKDGYLVLQMYDFYKLSMAGIDPSLGVGRYQGEWSQLYKVKSYLCPNNALNYLYYILDGTRWTVALREDGTPDVDIVKKEIPNPNGNSSEWADSTCNVTSDNSNCYNAITAVCKSLQLYPVFDCINRTVALRQFAGKNYGLTYNLGYNLNNNDIKLDGDKVITKLHCYGGIDYRGSKKINIGEANKSYIQYFAGFYKNTSSLPTGDNRQGYWAVVDDKFVDGDFISIQYYGVNEAGIGDGNLKPRQEVRHGLEVSNYWEAGDNREVYFFNNGVWTKGTKLPSGNWEGTYTANGQQITVTIDPVSGMTAPWDPNDDTYIICRAPYGVEYILNLKWAYQNKWITKEQILELYQKELIIHNLNENLLERYAKDLTEVQTNYYSACNKYDLAQDDFQSTLNLMASKYFIDETDVGKGTRYCFHTAPQGTYTKNGKHYIKIFHCYNCQHTQFIAPNGKNPGANITKCPKCGVNARVSSDTKLISNSNNEIYIPLYSDWDDWVTEKNKYPLGTVYEGAAYNPHLKGCYLRLVSTLDRMDNTQQDNWTIEDYEKKISLIELIDYDPGKTFDGYNYYFNITDSSKVSKIYVRSTSGQIEIWNEYINKYLKGFGDMLEALQEMEYNLEKIHQLQSLQQQWEDAKKEVEEVIQELYGDYLVEGKYTNDEQPYANLLFNESREASDKYAVPEVTYNLNVVDSSGLIEYRLPTLTKYICTNCQYTEYKPITECPRCGEQHLIIEKDGYNDLVHMLHSLGQIVPKAGDYCSIVDEPMGMFGVPGLITEIQRHLDNPKNNSVKLDTSYTDDEELVGNIITATNTVLNNSDIYARTAVLKGDGTIDPASLRTSLENSKDDITIIGTDGSVLLNSSGLRCIDPSDPQRAMKYAGNGIYKTDNFEASNGEAVVWERMMGPTGINANYINAGTIDTNKITVLSGRNGKVLIDQNGLAVKKDVSKSTHIAPFSSTQAKLDGTYASKWGEENNIASFIGVDISNNPLVYTKGFLVAEEGSNIGNWITSDQGFYHLKNNTKDLWLSPTGISGTINGNTKDMTIYANGNFGVDKNGILYANGAKIYGTGEFAGKVVINTADSSMLNGTITGGTIGGMTITSDSVYTIHRNGQGAIETGTGLSSNGSKYAFWAGETNGAIGSVSTNATFKVGHNGILSATGATIDGTITSKSGNIGGWTLNDGYLGNLDGSYSEAAGASSYFLSQNGKYAYWSHDSVPHNWFLYFKNKFGVDTDGKLYASGASISGTIATGGLNGGTIKGTTIEGGTIIGTTLKAENVRITDDGIYFPWSIESEGFRGTITTTGDGEIILDANEGIVLSGTGIYLDGPVSCKDGWTGDIECMAANGDHKWNMTFKKGILTDAQYGPL